MKYVFGVISVILAVLFFVRIGGAEEPLPAETSPKDEIPQERIDLIEISVSGRILTVSGKNPEGQPNTKVYKAATASPGKNSRNLSYGREGRVWKIALNPTWYLPKNIKKENYLKKGKIPPESIPPGKHNPLGKIKLFVSYGGINSSFGIHNTNKPKSIGKRVTHGCARMAENDIFEMARVIFEQNGIDSDKLFQDAAENPKKTIEKLVEDGPSVYIRK